MYKGLFFLYGFRVFLIEVVAGEKKEKVVLCQKCVLKSFDLLDPWW